MRNFTVEIDLYLNYCENIKALSHHTMRAYKIDMQQFIDFVKNKYPSVDSILSIDRVILQAYYQYLLINYAIKSVKRKMACLRACLKTQDYWTISTKRG